jgi:hypothetical protein
MGPPFLLLAVAVFVFVAGRAFLVFRRWLRKVVVVPSFGAGRVALGGYRHVPVVVCVVDGEVMGVIGHDFEDHVENHCWCSYGVAAAFVESSFESVVA